MNREITCRSRDPNPDVSLYAILNFEFVGFLKVGFFHFWLIAKNSSQVVIDLDIDVQFRFLSTRRGNSTSSFPSPFIS